MKISIKLKKWLLGGSITGALVFSLAGGFISSSIHELFYPAKEIITDGDEKTHHGLNKIEELLISQGETSEEINNLLKQLLGNDYEVKLEITAVYEYLEEKLQNETIEEILEEKDKFIEETDKMIRMEENNEQVNEQTQENQNINKITIDPNRLTVQFVNQYGNVFNNRMAWNDLALYDMEGQKVSDFSWSKYGSYLGDDLYAERLAKTEIPSGTYYIRWGIGKIMASTGSRLSEYKNRYSVQRLHSSGQEQVIVPQNDSWFIILPVQQTGIEYAYGTTVQIRINNQDGTPYNSSIPSSQKLIVTILNNDGKKISGPSMFNTTDGLYEYDSSSSKPPGKYLMKISGEEYKTKSISFELSDVSSWSDEEIWEKQPNKIDLGTITMEKL